MLFRSMASLGVTTMSAESKTEPGGYYTYPQALEQFHVTYVVSIPAINNVTINNVFISILFDFYIKRIELVISSSKVIQDDKIHIFAII